MFSKTADWIGEKDFFSLVNKERITPIRVGRTTLTLNFLAGELESTSAEYKLLEQMNR